MSGRIGRALGVRLRGSLKTRRGVASVLAMMFLVMFSSLGVAMAIVSQGNLRTAGTHLHIVRAMGAAETGMAVAQARLFEASRRFVVERGEVDADFGSRLWSGTLTSSYGEVDVRPPTSGFLEASTPAGIVQALINAFTAQQNVVYATGLPAAAETHSAPEWASGSEYRLSDWMTTPVYAIDGAAGDGARPMGYQVTFAPLANGTDVRIIATGYSSIGAEGSDYFLGGADADGNARPVTRVIRQDFRVVKRHEHAIVSPSRIMIGKNVLINGALGARYTDVEQDNGHPMTLRSDFAGLDAGLDTKLTALLTAITEADVDGDNRLRTGHAIEGAAIPADDDFNGDGAPDGAYDDATQDGYVDEFDVFLRHYDSNNDGRVVLSAALTAGTPAAGLSPEFTGDDDLALLLDSANPDRNHNGVFGFDDANGNGRWDEGEEPLDYDKRNDVYPDVVLGWRDGVIDRKDRYAKVRGKLQFRVTSQEWVSAQGPYQEQLRGPIHAAAGESPIRFGTPEEELPPIDAGSFTDTETPLKAAADGDPFDVQVAEQIGASPGQLDEYTESNTDPTAPRYWRADLDDSYVYAQTGRHIYEKMPFNAPSFSDWYYRARYENMVFRDVEIPRGANALFVNCTFVGVTYVRSYVENTHANWGLYGKLEMDAGSGLPIPVEDPLDKSDFDRYVTGDPADGPANYDDFPDPPVIDGLVRTGEERDTKRYSNNIRFHDCLFVGSIVSDTPQEFQHVRNKLQFTGSTRFTQQHPTQPLDPGLNPEADDLPHIRLSSMMAPNYSVDVGSFNSPTDTFQGGPPGQNVELRGTIVAGVLDVRGTASVIGTLLLTFEPIAGQGPLQDHNGLPIGNPAGFNTTIGYFGPEDGDGESLDPESLPIVDGQRIVGWDLDGDGIPDLGPEQTPSSEQMAAGATTVPFYGYGRIVVEWDPSIPMPDGIMLPVTVTRLPDTYREGRH